MSLIRGWIRPMCMCALLVGAEKCYLPLDVMFVQDTTGSFADDLPNMLKQLPDLLEGVVKQNPGSVFGLAEFRDKPYLPLGEADDYCYRLQQGLTDDWRVLYQEFQGLRADGGGDTREGQYQAMINVAADRDVGWRDNATHLIVLSTDAQPHLDGDAVTAMGHPDSTVPSVMRENPGFVTNANMTEACNEFDYPSPSQLRDALLAREVYVVFLTPEDPITVPSWNWVNEQLLGQPADFYQMIKSDSSDLTQGVLRAIEAVTRHFCGATLEPAGSEDSITIEEMSVDASRGSSSGFEPAQPTATLEIPEKCRLPLDVVFLQDTTQSFEDDLPNVYKQLPKLVESVLLYHPNSKFAIAEFRDKPFYPFGWPDDTCYRACEPLSADLDTIQRSYAALKAEGGADLSESHYQALINLAYDDSIGWRDFFTWENQTGDRTGARLIVMSTDARPHFSGDCFKEYENSTIPAHMKINPGIVPPNVTWEQLCNEYDYPSPDQVKAALRSRDIFLVTLTPMDPPVNAAWDWVNRDLLGQPKDFYQLIESDSSDIFSGIIEALTAVTEYTCLGVSTVAPQSTVRATSLATRSPAECVLPIDVVFLQDTTLSFAVDLPNVLKQLPTMMATILDYNPHSAFGLATFRDKPYYPLGFHDDYCYSLEQNLTLDPVELYQAYQKIVASGGGDLPEAQYQALMNAAYDDRIGWRRIDRATAATSTIHTGAHVIVLITDAVPHLPGDTLKYADYPDSEVPQDLHKNPGITINTAFETICRNYQYPSPEQLKAALEARDIYLAILTPEDPEVVAAWDWVNTQLLGQPASFYDRINEDSSDLLTGVLDVLAAVTTHVCFHDDLTEPTDLPETEVPVTGSTTATYLPSDIIQIPAALHRASTTTKFPIMQASRTTQIVQPPH